MHVLFLRIDIFCIYVFRKIYFFKGKTLMSPQMTVQGGKMLFAISKICDVLSVILSFLPLRRQFKENQKQTKNGQRAECQEAELSLCRFYFLGALLIFQGRTVGVPGWKGEPQAPRTQISAQATAAGEESKVELGVVWPASRGGSSLGTSRNDSMCASRRQ